METRVEEQPTIVDTAKLALAILVVLGGLVAYYYFANQSALLRALAVIVALGAGIGVAFTSLQGRWLWKFIQGARVELNKV
ncbi:MAG TPA: preprotein translocase subunit SecE, partial [Gammaproteobacteria bacterium]|nr:preprotein translocase subunit SecE [Gammaproteobacteria bacterium]